MARSNKYEDFSPAFEQLLIRAYDALQHGAEEFPVDFNDQKTAHALRFRTYAYFRMLRECTLRPDLTALCSNLSIRVANCTMFIYRKGDDKDADALSKALKLPENFSISHRDALSISTPLDKNIEKLHSIRKQKSQ